jgi:hypothetical protein
LKHPSFSLAGFGRRFPHERERKINGRAAATTGSLEIYLSLCEGFNRIAARLVCSRVMGRRNFNLGEQEICCIAGRILKRLAGSAVQRMA